MAHKITITVNVDDEDLKKIEESVEIYLNEDAVVSALQGFLVKEYADVYQLLANNEIKINKTF